jgi:nitrogen fixation protein FixH
MKRSFTGWPVFETMIVAVMAGMVVFSNLVVMMSAIRWWTAAAESLIADTFRNR